MKFRRDHAHLEIKLPDILMPLFNKYKAGQDSPYLLMFAERYSSEDSFNANVNIGIKFYVRRVWECKRVNCIAVILSVIRGEL